MSVTKSAETTPGHYQALAKDRLIFDSHGYVKRMTDGGFNEQQAEALAAEQADLLNNLATRQDIEGVREELGGVRNELEDVKQNMATKAELGEVRNELEEVKLNMSTKAELEEVKRNMATKQDIELLRQENKTSAATLKFEMIKWMTWYFLSGLAVMAAMMTALAAVLKLT